MDYEEEGSLLPQQSPQHQGQAARAVHQQHAYDGDDGDDAGEEQRRLVNGVELSFRHLSLWDDVLPPSTVHEMDVLSSGDAAQEDNGGGGGGGKGKMHAFLRDVTGTIVANRLTVLYGDEDSGKIELLNVLCGRKTHGQIEGVLSTRAGSNSQHDEFYQHVCYIDGRVFLPPYLTVQSHLEFIAEMQMPKGTSVHDRQMRVDKVLDLLDIRKIAHRTTSAGKTSRRTLSPAQKLVVAVAAAVLSNPTHIFILQPTDLLNSFEASRILSRLQSLATVEEITIVATASNIGTDSFKYIDQLMLLHQGEILYFGEGASAKVSDYMEAQGFASFSADKSPTEYFAAIIKQGVHAGSGNVQEDHHHSSKTTSVLANQYRAFAGASGGQVDAGRRAVKPFSKRPTLDVLTTTWVLTKRIVRSHMSFSRWFIPLAQVLVLSLIMLSVYIEIGSDTKNQQLARFGFLFLSPFLFLLSPLGVVHDQFEERFAIESETRNAVHHIVSYYAATAVTECVVYFIGAMLWLTATYWTLPLWRHDYTYFYAVFVLAVIGQIGLWVMQIIIDLVRDVRKATMMFYYWVALSIPFCGFFIRFPEIPVYWTWAYWIAPLHWAFACLMLNEVDGNYAAYEADQRDILLAYGLWVADPVRGIDAPFLGGHINHLAVLCAFMVVFRLASFLTLKLRTL